MLQEGELQQGELLQGELQQKSSERHSRRPWRDEVEGFRFQIAFFFLFLGNRE